MKVSQGKVNIEMLPECSGIISSRIGGVIGKGGQRAVPIALPNVGTLWQVRNMVRWLGSLTISNSERKVLPTRQEDSYQLTSHETRTILYSYNQTTPPSFRRSNDSFHHVSRRGSEGRTGTNTVVASQTSSLVFTTPELAQDHVRYTIHTL